MYVTPALRMTGGVMDVKLLQPLPSSLHERTELGLQEAMTAILVSHVACTDGGEKDGWGK